MIANRFFAQPATACLPLFAVLLFTGLAALGAPDVADDPAARALEEYKAATGPDEVERLFDEFCLAHFGAEKEPLVYELFGDTLKLLRDGEWTYPSRNSASIAWETNLPARAHIEYGPTEEYGRATRPTKRYYYIHLQYLKGLKPGQTIHYRICATDERGNKVVSEDRTITTKAMTAAIELPFKDAKPPYMLDKQGATYLLTEDIECPGSAFEVKADNVTLDLGGHTVIYHAKPLDKAVFTDKWMSYVHKGVFGIKAVEVKGLKILNGEIREGDPEGRGNDDSTGFNPVYLRGCADAGLMGVGIDYHSAQTSGLQTRHMSGALTIAHCVFNDRGTKMQNRHGAGCSTNGLLGPKDLKVEIYNNLVKRTRQNGLRRAEDLHNNEIYVDSWATNSFASGSVKNNGMIRDNRIFGTGYHVIAVPWGDGLTVKNNLVHLEGINTGKTRWWEGFGDQNSVNGLRHTQWGKNKTPSTDSLYTNNVVILNLQNGSQGRGVEFFADTYIKGLTLADSVVKVRSLDESTTRATCVVTHGSAGRNESHNPVTYRDVRFISNINNLRLGDYYGRGDNHRFYGCVFEKIGDHSDYHTIAARSSYWSRNHWLVDCRTAGGAKLDDVDWGKTKPGSRDYFVKWTLTIQARAGAAVKVTDARGNVEFQGKADADGKLGVPLTEFYMSHSGKEVRTPHKVEVVAGGKTLSREVNMTSSRMLEFK